MKQRIVFAMVLGLGLAAVAWVARGFAGSSWLAFWMTVVIGLIYLLGAWELLRYRAGSAQLGAALAQLKEPPPALELWLEQLPVPLRQAVRLRIEGERIAFPGPALTPYLVGLLVMLGMLGTFIGMVITFQGAVFALEGSSDLAAIRSALAAPIKGLGLSFGTSVAGVAASAMLGLLAALARRERAAVLRQLEASIATTLRPFSRSHQRHESLLALQQQTGTLPAVAEQLQVLSQQIEQRTQQLDGQLLERQNQFLREASTAYGTLAGAVALALQDSLAASARVASDNLRPLLESAMTQIAQQSERQHQQVASIVEQQLAEINRQFGSTAQGVSAGWASALAQQDQAQKQWLGQLEQSFDRWGGGFEQRSLALLAQWEQAQQQAQDARQQSDRQQRADWIETLHSSNASQQQQWQALGALSLAQQQSQGQTQQRLWQELIERSSAQSSQTLQAMADLLRQSETMVQQRAAAEAAWAGEQGVRMDQLAGQWRSELAALRQDEADRGEAAVQRLADLQAQVSQHLGSLGSALEGPMGRLLAQSDMLVRQHSEAAARWSVQHEERMDALAGHWRVELAQLRGEEQARGQAAVERLGQLQEALASQLATLGLALEAPMTRLLQTASEAPRAAADMVLALRQQMDGLAVRDTQALQERAALLEQTTSLLHGVQQATGAQREAIETLVHSASQVLAQTGQQFSQTLGAQTEQAQAVAAQVGASAVELASLGEAFAHGVQLFGSSNQQLVQSLQRLETALGQSMARSDEQLAYYVAQAREVIDLSISAQQGIVQDLRQLQGRQQVLAEEGAA